jgi:hypothetical protein
MYEKLYFETTEGDIVTSIDIANALYLITGIRVPEDERYPDTIRKYAESMKGVAKEINTEGGINNEVS